MVTYDKANIYRDFTCTEDAYRAFKITRENPNLKIRYNFESLPKTYQTFVNFTYYNKKKIDVENEKHLTKWNFKCVIIRYLVPVDAEFFDRYNYYSVFRLQRHTYDKKSIFKDAKSRNKHGRHDFWSFDLL